MHIYMLEIDLNGPIAEYSGQHEITGDDSRDTPAHTPPCRARSHHSTHGVTATTSTGQPPTTAKPSQTMADSPAMTSNPSLLGGDVLRLGNQPLRGERMIWYRPIGHPTTAHKARGQTPILPPKRSDAGSTTTGKTSTPATC